MTLEDLEKAIADLTVSVNAIEWVGTTNELVELEGMEEFKELTEHTLEQILLDLKSYVLYLREVADRKPNLLLPGPV